MDENTERRLLGALVAAEEALFTARSYRRVHSKYDALSIRNALSQVRAALVDVIENPADRWYKEP